MPFFDKLGETIASKSKDVAKKTKDFAEISSLNSQINGQENIIRDVYTEIGRQYFEANRTNLSDPYIQQMQVIFTAEAVIAERKQRIREIKGMKICATCGAEIPLGMMYCGTCGAPVPEPAPAVLQEEPEAQPESLKCPSCGAELPMDAAFCTSCGQKLQ